MSEAIAHCRKAGIVYETFCGLPNQLLAANKSFILTARRAYSQWKVLEEKFR
jgi:chromosomal replication initiation ATPase DnaA